MDRQPHPDQAGAVSASVVLARSVLRLSNDVKAI